MGPSYHVRDRGEMKRTCLVPIYALRHIGRVPRTVGQRLVMGPGGSSIILSRLPPLAPVHEQPPNKRSDILGFHLCLVILPCRTKYVWGRWRSWLSHLSNTQKVLSSNLGRLIAFSRMRLLFKLTAEPIGGDVLHNQPRRLFERVLAYSTHRMSQGAVILFISY